jgi:hypothetical protein
MIVYVMDGMFGKLCKNKTFYVINHSYDQQLCEWHEYAY